MEADKAPQVCGTQGHRGHSKVLMSCHSWHKFTGFLYRNTQRLLTCVWPRTSFSLLEPALAIKPGPANNLSNILCILSLLFFLLLGFPCSANEVSFSLV